MVKKFFLMLLSVTCLLLAGAGSASAFFDEDYNFADVYYEYSYSSDPSELPGESHRDYMDSAWNYLDGIGSIEVGSVFSESSYEMGMRPNTAFAEIVDKGLDFATGARVCADFDNFSPEIPSTIAGGYGVSNAYASIGFTKIFNITAAGSASVTFSLDGFLEAMGDASAGYIFNAMDNFSESSLFWDDSVMGFSMQVNQTGTFNYQFVADDIGSTLELTLDLFLYAEAGMYGEYMSPTGSENSTFYGEFNFGSADADFLDTMKVDFITGGIEAAFGDEVENQNPVPIPGTGMLLISGLVGMVALRRKV